MLSAECGYHEGASQSWGAIASKLNSQAFPDSSSHLLSKSKSFSAQITISWLLQITTKMGHRPAEVVGWTPARTHPLWASSPCREGERLAVLREEGRSLPSGWCRRETGLRASLPGGCVVLLAGGQDRERMLGKQRERPRAGTSCTPRTLICKAGLSSP